MYIASHIGGIVSSFLRSFEVTDMAGPEYSVLLHGYPVTLEHFWKLNFPFVLFLFHFFFWRRWGLGVRMFWLGRTWLFRGERHGRNE